MAGTSLSLDIFITKAQCDTLVVLEGILPEARLVFGQWHNQSKCLLSHLCSVGSAIELGDVVGLCQHHWFVSDFKARKAHFFCVISVSSG